MDIDDFHRPAQNSRDVFPQSGSTVAHESPPADLPDDSVDRSAQALIRNYQSYLKGRCRILARGNRDIAEELFSEVMLKVCTESPEKLRQIRHLGGWLNRIAHNRYIDAQREQQAKERRDDILGYLYETFGSLTPSPEREFLNGELDRQIRLAFEALPDRLRKAAHMRFHEEAPYEEIAAGLAISQANARKRIQEARTILVACLRPYIEDSSELHPAGIAASLALHVRTCSDVE